jgi:hypothetical protein
MLTYKLNFYITSSALGLCTRLLDWEWQDRVGAPPQLWEIALLNRHVANGWEAGRPVQATKEE